MFEFLLKNFLKYNFKLSILKKIIKMVFFYVIFINISYYFILRSLDNVRIRYILEDVLEFVF